MKLTKSQKTFCPSKLFAPWNKETECKSCGERGGGHLVNGSKNQMFITCYLKLNEVFLRFISGTALLHVADSNISHFN